MLNEFAGDSTELYRDTGTATALKDAPMSAKIKTKPPKRKERGSRRKIREIEVIQDKPSLAIRLRRKLFRPKILMWVAMTLLIVTVLPQIPSWLPNPADRREYQLETTDIRINEPPRYVPVDLVEQVVRRSKLPKTLSLLDDDLTKRIAQAFEAHPWVESVVSVRKSYPARVDVEVVYRKPVAMVAVVGGMYPIDKNSVLLPPVDFSVADTRRYPVIVGAPSPPQGAEGTRWGDISVNHAAILADALSPHWKALNLSAIRIPRQHRAVVKPDELMFELKTRGGSRILWGRAPGTNHPGELTPEQKIGRLQKYLADFGGFDHPNGPYEIDIRHWQEITRRPLDVRRENTARR
ncbi:MAG: hypothetical protein Tsb009_06010 [Planctomycetaceae bacterium]